MQASAGFTAGADIAAIAKTLRVHVRSVQRWRLAWDAEGEVALLSKGPPNHAQLSEGQFAVLETELERGPAAHGWPDQKWTLSRIKTMIGRRFHKSYTIRPHVVPSRTPRSSGFRAAPDGAYRTPL